MGVVIYRALEIALEIHLEYGLSLAAQNPTILLDDFLGNLFCWLSS